METILTLIAVALVTLLSASALAAWAYIRAGARSDREEADLFSAPEGHDGRR
jgi:hypothetical protein